MSETSLGRFISDDLLKENKKLHQSPQGFGGGGHKHAEEVNKFIRKYNCKTVLDFGCGEGTLKYHVKAPVYEFDPAIEGKEEIPRPCDLVVATDVLEHVEPEYLHNVLNALYLFTKKRCYVSIATRLSNKYLSDGRNVHLIVGNNKFWYIALAQYFYNIVELKPLRKGECRFVLS